MELSQFLKKFGNRFSASVFNDVTPNSSMISTQQRKISMCMPIDGQTIKTINPTNSVGRPLTFILTMKMWILLMPVIFMILVMTVMIFKVSLVDVDSLLSGLDVNFCEHLSTVSWASLSIVFFYVQVPKPESGGTYFKPTSLTLNLGHECLSWRLMAESMEAAQ